MTDSKKKQGLKVLPPPHPTEPAKASKPVTKALQNLMHGEANPHQQKIAMQWIINEASRAYGIPYVSGVDGERDTSYALGKSFVGQQIIGLLKINLLSNEE